MAISKQSAAIRVAVSTRFPKFSATTEVAHATVYKRATVAIDRGHDMRWPVTILAAACAVPVGILAYGQIAVITRDEQDWRQRELAFLTSVHNRMQADLANTSAVGVAASLRREQDSILQAMAAVAKPMPASSVPSDVGVLLPSGPPTDDTPIVDAVASERLARAATLVAREDSAAAPPAALAAGLVAAGLSSEARLGPVVRDVEPSSRPPIGTTAAQDSLSQLEATLHAEKTDRGLRVILPANALFGEAPAALDPAAALLLSSLAELTAAMQPREIVVIGPSVEEGADLGLSKDRAHAVTAWLRANGPKHRPHLVEQTRARPAAPNDSAAGSSGPDGREQNIEVLLRRR
jgi:flagellar motor protein MotB